jgi:hypothetical protein
LKFNFRAINISYGVLRYGASLCVHYFIDLTTMSVRILSESFFEYFFRQLKKQKTIQANWRVAEGCQGFRGKYYPKGGDFSRNPKGLTFTTRLRADCANPPSFVWSFGLGNNLFFTLSLLLRSPEYSAPNGATPIALNEPPRALKTALLF